MKLKVMRKMWVLLVLAWIGQAACGEENGVRRLFDDFGGKEGARRQVIDRKALENDEMLADVFEDVEGIDSLQVLDLIRTSGPVRKEFAEAVRKMQLPGYEIVIDTNEKGEGLRILTKKDEADHVSDLLMILSGTDCAVVRVRGTLEPTEELFAVLLLPLVALRTQEAREAFSDDADD